MSAAREDDEEDGRFDVPVLIVLGIGLFFIWAWEAIRRCWRKVTR